MVGCDDEKREPGVSEQWLEARAPGFRDLPEVDRRAMFDFAFLWSLFEAQVLEEKVNPNRIRQKVIEWDAAGILRVDLYNNELAYFKDRYIADGALTYHFPLLKLRSSDYPEIVRAVIEESTNDPCDRMLALLMIVWRLRNNLFHGAKWAYEFRDQRANFIQANSVLMRLLERHGHLD